MLKVVLDIDRDYTFDNALDDLSEYTLEASWNYGGVTKLGYVGTYAEMLPVSRSTIRLVDRTGAFNLKDSSATYHGKLKRGVLVRIQGLSVFDLTDGDSFLLRDNQELTLADGDGDLLRDGDGGDTLVDGNGDTLTDVLQYKRLAEHRIYKVDGTGKLPDGARMITIYAEDPTSNWMQQKYIPRLQKNVRIDQIITDTIDDSTLPYPYPLSGAVVGIAVVNESAVEYSSNFVDFNQARTTLEFAGDVEPQDSTVMAHLVQHLTAEGGGRLFWSRDAKLVFHNRYRDLTQTTSIELTDDDIDEAIGENGAQVSNHITVNYAVRELGTPSSKIAEATNLPIKFEEGDTWRTFRLPFRSFTTDQRIASDNVITPVIGTDIVFYDAEIYGSEDNDLIAVSVERIGAREIVLNLRNFGPEGPDPRKKDRWLYTLQVRGDPLITYDRQSVVIFDAESIQDNGKYPMELNYAVIDDSVFAESLGRYTLKRYKNLVDTIGSITMTVHLDNVPDICMMDIGSILHIDSTQENVDEEFVVIGQEWQMIADNSQRSMVVMHLKPLNREPVAVVNKAVVNLENATVVL